MHVEVSTRSVQGQHAHVILHEATVWDYNCEKAGTMQLSWLQRYMRANGPVSGASARAVLAPTCMAAVFMLLAHLVAHAFLIGTSSACCQVTSTCWCSSFGPAAVLYQITESGM